jgi:hypothetical protein
LGHTHSHTGLDRGGQGRPHRCQAFTERSTRRGSGGVSGLRYDLALSGRQAVVQTHHTNKWRVWVEKGPMSASSREALRQGTSPSPQKHGQSHWEQDNALTPANHWRQSSTRVSIAAVFSHWVSTVWQQPTLCGQKEQPNLPTRQSIAGRYGVPSLLPHYISASRLSLLNPFITGSQLPSSR